MIEKKMKRPYWQNLMIVLYSMILYMIAPMIVGLVYDGDLGKIGRTSIQLTLAALCYLLIVPGVFKVPVGGSITNNLKRIGLYLPTKLSKHIVVGVIMVVCTLTGLFISATLGGDYTFDISQVKGSQIYFALLPGIFEEIIFRGFIMFILIAKLRDIKKAALFQSLIFVVCHINGTLAVDHLLDLFVIFCLSLLFTYVAYRTKTLIAGIVFHYLHDAFLFGFQQPPEYILSLNQSLIFVACMVVMIVVAGLLLRILTKSEYFKTMKSLYSVDAME